MNIERIYCGLCGHATESALFEHLRDEHKFTPEHYAQQCPNAPLFTTAFRDFVAQQGAHVGQDEAGIMVTRELFGVAVSCPAAAQSSVPAVDEQYHFVPEQTRAILQSLVADDRILLVGPTGSGKSSLIAQLAARLNWPLTKVNLHGETSTTDMLGQLKVRDGEVVFQYGVLPRAMRYGHVLVLEELDAATPEMLFVLQGVLEPKGCLTLHDNGAEIVEPHPRFRIVATANTLGTGDEAGLYTGTHILNASHLDRWTSVFRIGYLGEDEELKVVNEQAPTLDHALLSGLVKLANAVRKATEENQLYTPFSTRRLLALARKIEPLGLATALEVTVLNKLGQAERAVVAELAQRHLPGLDQASAA